MAISIHTVWEVRTTGNDSNGGGFAADGAGTDYSQQDTPQVVIDNATITTSITGAVVTFTAGYAPAAADVGNLVQFLTGTNVTPGFYQVLSRTATTWTLDSAPITTGTTTNATARMGGALATLDKLSSGIVSRNKAFVRSGTYTTSAGVTFGPASQRPTNGTRATRVIGYYQVRGDIYPGVNAANRPVIQGTTTGITAIGCTANGVWVENLIVDRGGAATSIAKGISNTGSYGRVLNCKTSNTSSRGIEFGNTNSIVAYCEATSTQGGYGIVQTGLASGCSVHDCWVHDLTGGTAGIAVTGGTDVIGNLVTNCAGASCDGIYQGIGSGGDLQAVANTVYNSGRDGIRIDNNGFVDSTLVKGNILANSGGYGLNFTQAALPADWAYDGNAFYSNTSGNRNNLDTTTSLAIDGVAPYVNRLDVVLTASPFTSAAGGDFTLNSTAGGGAAARAAGFPNAWAGSSLAGYRDMGAIQHQDSGGGGGGYSRSRVVGGA